MPEPITLNSIDQRMLRGPFYVSGWHNAFYIHDARKLVERGWLTERDTSSSQETRITFEPTEAGRAVLKAWKEALDPRAGWLWRSLDFAKLALKGDLP